LETGDDHDGVVAGAGSPVRIDPETLARCALLACAHFAAGRAGGGTGGGVERDASLGRFRRSVRRRAAARLEQNFLPPLRTLLSSAPMLHADETTGRSADALTYVHAACTEYLTLRHVGGRSATDIEAGNVLCEFTGILVRDGYAGYEHLRALHDASNRINPASTSRLEKLSGPHAN
jgi:transposase